MSLLQPMMVAALLITGMGVAILGSVKVPLAKRLAIDEAKVGGLVSLFGFVMIPVILTAGFFTDLLGPQLVMAGGSLLFAAGLIALARANKYAHALIGVLLVSGGWSFMINVGNVLTPLAFSGSKAQATNLANVFFGMGAFLTPLAVGFLVGIFSLPRVLFLLGGLALVPGLLALGIDFSEVRLAAGPETNLGTTMVLEEPYLWLLGFALFFYGPLEASMGAWATTYLGNKGLPEASAAGFLSAFWLAFMASRLATAFTLPPQMETQLIFVLALCCVAVLSGVAFGRGRSFAMIMVVLAGLVFGPIFPTLMALLLGHFYASVQGRAVGMFFAIGGIGWTMIPMLIGSYARRTNVQRGFSIAVAAALGLSAISLVLLVGY